MAGTARGSSLSSGPCRVVGGCVPSCWAIGGSWLVSQRALISAVGLEALVHTDPVRSQVCSLHHRPAVGCAGQRAQGSSVPLSFLHSCEPPIIHGNLTSDTIFIQHNGLIKIGSGRTRPHSSGAVNRVGSGELSGGGKS